MHPIFFRIGYGLSSVAVGSFGFITIIPNVMLGDAPNNPAASRSAFRGLVASGMFITTGVCGLISAIFLPSYTIIMPIGLLASTALQLSAFIRI